MKLKFIPASENAMIGARVVNMETGEDLERVVSVKYEHRAGAVPTLSVEVYCMPGYTSVVDRELISYRGTIVETSATVNPDVGFITDKQQP